MSQNSDSSNNANSLNTNSPNSDSDSKIEFIPMPPPGIPNQSGFGTTPNVHSADEVFNNIYNAAEQGDLSSVKSILTGLGKSAAREGTRMAFDVAVNKAAQAWESRGRSGGGKGSSRGSRVGERGTPGGGSFTGGKGGGPKGGSGGTGSNDDIPNTLPHTHTGLDAGHPPTEIRLSTGIKPNCSAERFHRAVQDKVSPLHMTGAIATIGALPTSTFVSDFMGKVVLTNFKTKLQRSISFSIPTNITDANLLGALEAMFKALQYYYFADATLQYASNPANWNEGILNLRSNMSSIDLNTMYSLRRILQALPIPPNMRQLSFYLMQIYASGSVPGAPLIRICPIPCVDNALGLIDYSTKFNACITELIGYSNVYNVIAAACPHWVNEDLGHGFIAPVHDNNFSTIFANLGYKGVSSVAGSVYTYNGPPASGVNDEINYNSYTDNLDGIAYCCTSIYVTAYSTHIPGLVIPVISQSQTNAITNRMSWYNNGTTSLWLDPFMNVNYKLALARGETYAATGWNNYQDSILNFGSELCLGVSTNSIAQTTLSAIDWIISLDSMSKPGKRKWGGKE